MEKISQIIRGNSRVAAVDLKNSPAVRPGVPSFGRPIGDSQQSIDRMESTANRAVAMQHEMNETRKHGPDRATIQQTADQFFMSRNRPAHDEFGPISDPHLNDAQSVQPEGFKPKGTYVNVLA